MANPTVGNVASNSSNSASSLDVSITVSAGTDTILLAWADAVDNTTDKVTSVTLDPGGANETSFTLVDEVVTAHSVQHQVAAFVLVNPPTGTYTVRFAGSGGVARFIAAVMQIDGVDQSTPTGATGSGSGTGITNSVSVTTTAADSLVVASSMHGNAAGFTPGTSVTEHWDISQSGYQGWGGHKAATTTGSYTVDADNAGSAEWNMLGVEVLAAGGASAVTVNASPGVVSVSGPAATVDAATTVQASAGVVSVVGVQASVSSAVVVSASAGVVSVSAPSASISSPIVVSAAPGVVSVSAIAATVDAATTVQASAGVVSVAGQQATITSPIVVSAAVATVQAVGVGATITVPTEITLEETVTGSVDGSTSFSLTSWTPAANELILLAVAVRDETVTITPSGNGLTWVEVADVDNVQGQCGIAVFRAMGSSPSSGQISVSLSSSTVAVAIASRFSGVDTSGSNGSGAVESSATNSGPDPDDDDMVVSVTTATADAWAWAAGTHRNNTFTVPGDETGISINQTDGTSGDVTSLSTWYKEQASAGTVELGAAADLSSDSDWATIGVSIKPEFVGPVTVNASPGVVSVGGVSASVSATTTVQASPGVVTVAGIPATVGVFVNVSASPGVISVSGPAATIVAPQVISASPGVVTVVGVGASVAITNDVTIAAATGEVQVVGVPVFVDTVRYLLDVEVSDAAAYTLVLQDEAVYSVALQDEAPYAVELVDASRS